MSKLKAYLTSLPYASRFPIKLKQNVISEYWNEIGQLPFSENFSLKCQLRIGLYGVKAWHFTKNVRAHRPFWQPQILLFMMADIS